MGLLDALLSNQNLSGFGGLLGGQYLPGQSDQPNYATNEFDSQFLPQRPDPFGGLPQQPQRTEPMPMAAQAPIFGAPATPSILSQQQATPALAPAQAPIFGTSMPSTIPQQQEASAPAPVQPPTDVSSQAIQPTRTLDIGGYQMPQFGNAPEQVTTPPNARPTQGQLPQSTPEQLPQALGGRPSGFFDSLNTGLQSIGNGGSLIGALTGNRTDPASLAQQSLKAQYDALVPLVGPQKAMLAVLNPEAGKTILAQALEKKQYGFTKLDNDTVVSQDPQTGKVAVAYSSDKSNTIAGPDGKMITMPEGADPKIWRNEITRINADVAAGKKTEVQAKAEIFANKMEMSNKTLGALEGQGTSLPGKIASGVPLGNYVQTPEYQKYKQAASNFITALLRQESGAAISKSEFERYDKEYMPQPGDSQSVLEQKSEARRVAIEGMKKGAGPGYKSPTASPLPAGWSVKVN